MHGTDDFRVTGTHTAPKGAEFEIRKDGPLFVIHMKSGGVRPAFLENRFTSHKLAMQALDRYFRNNPKPEPRTTTPESRAAKVEKTKTED